MKNLIQKMFFEKTSDTKIQFFRYLFVGGLAAVVNIGTLYIFTEFTSMYYLISNILGFIAGLLVNYFLSRYLVFNEEKTDKKIFEFVSYTAIGVMGLGLDTLFMWLFTSKFLLYYLISKIISTGLVFIWNFSIRKILYVIINKKLKNSKGE